MVGIVVVSHSRRLAEGVAELAQQMMQGRGAIAIAAGVDDPDNPIGTDAVAIMSAIEQVCGEEGAVVLMDMGSALLSTEMALELLDEETRQKVSMVSAPLVEGTLAAAVAAAGGLSREAVIAEAQQALSAKQAHLGDLSAQAAAGADNLAEMSVSDRLCFEWQVTNPHGLHARPAAAVVSALAPFHANVMLEKEGRQVSARSLNSITRLDVRLGEHIRFLVSGEDAQQALSALEALAKDQFGDSLREEEKGKVQDESDRDEPASLPSVPGAISGLRISDGVATAPAVIFTTVMPDVPIREFDGYNHELARLNLAIDRVRQQLAEESRLHHGAIFEAHSLMLSDPDILAELDQQIQQDQIAEQAWVNVMNALAEQYALSGSQYMREREADIHDIARRVMVELTGEKGPAMTLDKPCVLLARDLLPSDMAGLDHSKVLAICLSEGGKTSHSSILARAMGIPAIIKVTGCLEQVVEGQKVTVDGFTGRLWLTPGEETLTALEARRKSWLEEQKLARLSAREKAVTLDGETVSVLANIGGPDDVAQALECGAEGVGLFRTEFLFQSRGALPGEEEQYQIYQQIAAAFGSSPVTIRSLDVGGDKPLDAFPMPEEDNPFLGLRGIRLCLAHQELFRPQLRAILRAYAEHSNIQLMIPMVATVGEVRQVKAMIEEEKKSLGLTQHLPLGIMIEIPAAVFNAASLAREVDFFSIGTNDLTQYVMAADRGNSSVTGLVDYFSDAVIKAIEMTCEAGRIAGIPVSMCGEMAGDTQATARLLRLGLTKFSASAPLLPALKATIRQCRSR